MGNTFSSRPVPSQQKPPTQEVVTPEKTSASVHDPAGPGPEHAPTPHLDYTKYLSRLAQTWPQGSLRSFFPPDAVRGKLSLGGGLPASQLFSFKELSVSVPDRDDGSTLKQLTVDSKLLDEALQYGPTGGLSLLRDWVIHHTAKAHDHPIVDPSSPKQSSAHTKWGVAFGSGIQDVIDKVFRALLSPGDTILVEAPTYPGVFPCILTIGADAHCVNCDAGGLSSEALANTLANWTTSPETSHKKFPKAIYTVPVGGNPSGTSATTERKRQNLALVRKYGLLMIEDDPYYYLAFDSSLGTEDPVTRPRTKSYLALEQEDVSTWGDGRVVRLDSFSKIISAGMRVGYVTAAQDIIDAIDTVASASSMQASGPAAALTATLLQYWGEEGFLRSCDRAALFYRNKRDAFEHAAAQILGGGSRQKTEGAFEQKELATWVTPAAGMFLWLKLKLPSTPEAPEGDATKFIQFALDRGVVAVPGFLFFADKRTTPFLRVAFSQVPDDKMLEGFTLLRLAIEDAWRATGNEP